MAKAKYAGDAVASPMLSHLGKTVSKSHQGGLAMGSRTAAVASLLAVLYSAALVPCSAKTTELLGDLKKEAGISDGPVNSRESERERERERERPCCNWR